MVFKAFDKGGSKHSILYGCGTPSKALNRKPPYTDVFSIVRVWGFGGSQGFGARGFWVPVFEAKFNIVESKIIENIVKMK